MLRIIVVVLSLTFANVVLGDNADSNKPQCEIDYGGTSPDFPCNGFLSTDPRCNNSFVKVANTLNDACSDINIYWNYPMRNLTLTIESANYTKLRQPFTVSLKRHFGYPIYRIFSNGQEVLISNKTSDPIVVPSDDNYQVVVKIQGPERLKFYESTIEYQMAPLYN